MTYQPFMRNPKSLRTYKLDFSSNEQLNDEGYAKHTSARWRNLPNSWDDVCVGRGKRFAEHSKLSKVLKLSAKLNKFKWLVCSVDKSVQVSCPPASPLCSYFIDLGIQNDRKAFAVRCVRRYYWPRGWLMLNSYTVTAKYIVNNHV